MTTTKTAKELLGAMRGCGFTLELNGDSLDVRQARWIDDELMSLIKQYKIELMAILEQENHDN